MAGAAAASSKKKKVSREDVEGSNNPEITERRRLRTLAFSNNILSQIPAKTLSPLAPSKTVTKHHGKDIVKKSQRKNKFLFSFPGLLAPIGSGKIGELKDLGTKNPVLYLDFPQGRMKLFGTIVYPKNRYLTLQFPRGGKSVTCEDYFDNMIVFSNAWWIGSLAENPEEAQLDFPKELSDGQHAGYDFKGGAGGAACSNKQICYKAGISHVEEESSKSTPEGDLSEGEDKDLKATPVRHSARTVGKKFKFAEASSGDDSMESDANEYEEKNKLTLGSLARNYTSGKKENVCPAVSDIVSEDSIEETQSPIQNQQSAPLKTESKKQSSISIKMNKSGDESSSNHGSLVQTTISTLFKKVEEKRTPRIQRKVSSARVSNEEAQLIDSKRKISQTQDGVTKKKTKLVNDKKLGGKGVAKKKAHESEEDDIDDFSSASLDNDGSDEDWAA